MSSGIKKIVTILLYTLIIGSLWGTIGSLHWMITDGSFKTSFHLMLAAGLPITGAVMTLLWGPLPNRLKTTVAKLLFHPRVSTEIEEHTVYTRVWLSIASCLVIAGVIIGLFY
jgi:hypothetical protein